MIRADFGEDEYDKQFDPSPYEVAMREQQETYLLNRQIKRHGDEAMRVGVSMPVGGNVPTENFVRSYQLKMPNAKVDRTKEKPDPCKRLLKAMNLKISDQSKTRRHAYDEK